MKFQFNDLPLEVWHVTEIRVRKGLGVQRLVPIHASMFPSRNVSFRVNGRKGVFYENDCYTNKQGAINAAHAMIHGAKALALARFDDAMLRLRRAEQTLEEQK